MSYKYPDSYKKNNFTCYKCKNKSIDIIAKEWRILPVCKIHFQEDKFQRELRASKKA